MCGLRWAVPMKRPVVSGTFPFPCARSVIADGHLREGAAAEMPCGIAPRIMHARHACMHGMLHCWLAVLHGVLRGAMSPAGL